VVKSPPSPSRKPLAKAKEPFFPIDLNDIVIDKIYRFTGQNDLDDEAILYAMRNRKDGAKGVFVNGYGTYTDSGANAVISKINVEENDNDDWTVEK
jgi:hypothetical protein